jgi:hypothetical protein
MWRPGPAAHPASATAMVALGKLSTATRMTEMALPAQVWGEGVIITRAAMSTAVPCLVFPSELAAAQLVSVMAAVGMAEQWLEEEGVATLP